MKESKKKKKRDNNRSKDNINYNEDCNRNIYQRNSQKEDDNKNKEINYMGKNKIKYIEENDEYKELQKSK